MSDQPSGLRGRKPGDRRVRVERPRAEYFRYAGPGTYVARPKAHEPRGMAGRALARTRRLLVGRPLETDQEIEERLSKKRRWRFSARTPSAPAPTPGQTVLAQVSSAVYGPGSVGFYLFQAFTALLLILAANTSGAAGAIAFNDPAFPRRPSRAPVVGFRDMPDTIQRPVFTKALLGLSGGPTDELVVHLACQLAKPARATLIAVHVVEVDWRHDLAEDLTSDHEEASATLDIAEGIAQRYKVELSADLLQAREVGPALVDEAAELGADALIVGLPYRQRFGGDFALGTTVPYVFQNAPCQVIVVREPVATSEERRVAAGGPSLAVARSW